MRIITISGAQGSGKTSLTQRLVSDLKPYGRAVIVPSFSNGLLQKCYSLGIRTYDDINRLSLRTIFQDMILASLVEKVSQIVNLRHEPEFAKTEIVIVDRWYLDAMAYSKCEMPNHDYQPWLAKCLVIIEHLEKTLAEYPTDHFITTYLGWDKNENKPSRSTYAPSQVELSIIEHTKVIPTIKHTILNQDHTDARSNYIVNTLFPRKHN